MPSSLVSRICMAEIQAKNGGCEPEASDSLYRDLLRSGNVRVASSPHVERAMVGAGFCVQKARIALTAAKLPAVERQPSTNAERRGSAAAEFCCSSATSAPRSVEDS